MIVPMQKVAVLCAHRERLPALARLQQLGVVHLQVGPQLGDDQLDAARTLRDRLQQALALLDAEPAPSDAGDRRPEDLPAFAERVLAGGAARAELQRRRSVVAAERAEVAPFGNFDPAAVVRLRAAGLGVALHRLPHGKTGLREALAVPAGVVVQQLGETAEARTAVVVAPPCVALAAGLPLPERSLGAIDAELAELDAELQRRATELSQGRAARPALVERLQELDERVELLAARAGMAGAGAVAWVCGFCPVDQVESLRAAATADGMAIVLQAPTADDIVPTLVRSPKWVQQVQAVLTMLGITPGYTEPDVGWLFLAFLVLFASMLIGDAGYGALLLGATFAFGRGRAPSQAIRLIRTLGVGTIVWGAITGTWFAIPNLPAGLDALRIDWLAGGEKKTTERHIMLLCFLLGALHLTLAHLWAAIRCGKTLPALAQLGWIASTWTMFAIARTMVLGEAFPGFMTTVAIVGIAAIVLFMTPVRQIKNEWFNHVMLPLSLVSNFVDVVSYLRLFAVGSAGVAVAQSFNAMAAQAAAGGGLGWLVAALIAVFGHSLNLALCAMGVLVHGVRLNTLEFSSHLGLQWNGIAYRPFARHRSAGGLDNASVTPEE